MNILALYSPVNLAGIDQLLQQRVKAPASLGQRILFGAAGHDDGKNRFAHLVGSIQARTCKRSGAKDQEAADYG
jgi:hypothetical protein